MTQRPIEKEYNLIHILEDKRKRGARMKRIFMLFPAVLFIALASIAYAQSLADLAQKEKERRQEVKNDKVVTDDEVAKFRSEPSTTNTADKPDVKPDSEKKAQEPNSEAKSEKTEPDEPVDFQGRPESYWRQTMADARQKVKDLENQANVLALKINDLQNRFYTEDDGFKRETIGREINKSFYEQDKNKEDLAKARDMLQELEKEARKSGALPGWTR